MWGAIAGGVLGGAASYFGQKEANASNERMAREQMQFQERMSSTAHQREVSDLKAAGLNPVLSAGGSGASSPGGASPVIQSETEGVAANAKEMAANIASLRNLKADTELKIRNQKLIEANTATANAQARIVQRQAAISDVASPLIHRLGQTVSPILRTSLDGWDGLKNRFISNPRQMMADQKDFYKGAASYAADKIRSAPWPHYPRMSPTLNRK